MTARVLFLCGAAIALLAAAPVQAAPAPVLRKAHTVDLRVDEGSDFSAVPSPRGAGLIMDLQGVLWALPAQGGMAKRLTQDVFEALRPRWSPDGRQVAVQAYADGLWRIWLLSPDGKSRKVLTNGPYDATHPTWAPDGKSVAFVSDRSGADEIWAIDVATGALRQLTNEGGGVADPAWSPDGREIAFTRWDRIRIVAVETGETATLPLPADPARRPTGPAWSPDGKSLAYVAFGAQTGRLMVADRQGRTRRIGALDNAFSFAPTWLSADRLLYTANGKIRTIGLDGQGETILPFRAKLKLRRAGYARKVYDFDDTKPHLAKGLVGPALSPDGKSAVFKALNDLWLVPIDGGPARKLTDDRAYEVDPAWSPDGKSIAFASDRAGQTHLFVMDIASGLARQVTDGEGAQTSPAWSPAGDRLAYQTETGETRLLDLSTGQTKPLLGALETPGRPSWSPDGRTLVVTAVNQRRNRILAVDVESGRQTWRDPAPFRSVSTRGDDGPVWSPDGKHLLFSMESTLWILPVAADGTPKGPARQITHEASDAPSWGGDAKTVLYVHNGRLRLTNIEGAEPRTIETGLGWTQQVARGRTLVHAGALWDGVHEAVRRDVDILVIDNRIAAITPHAAHRADIAVVDASHLTVTPGLFEMHNHQQMRSKFLGDRQGRLWLAFGVTSTRSPGDPAYRAVEDRESLASGARLGPRLFTTGEMLEGSRLMWAFSRPVETKAQLKLELSRAQALDYDLIKTYMRFRSDWQVKVADWGHKTLGVSTTSHFVFPGVAHGVDGAEHFGGPTRWGFVFPHLFRGDVYADTLDGLAKSGMELTTTNFSSKRSLLDLPGVADDPRVKAFYPPWELASLRRTIACADTSGPCDFFLPPDEQGSRLTVRDLLRIKRAGGQVMIGTDAPLDHPALSLVVNMMSLQEYGFSPFEVLQAATSVPARAQGVERDLGTVEVGKLADLVFVDGDPSVRIADLVKVRQVMKAGTLYTVEALISAHDDRRMSVPAPERRARLP